MDEDKKIILNRIKCLHCGDVIVSSYTHDYKKCSCGKVSVDGGTSYLKRGFQVATDYEEMSLFDDAPFEEIRKNLRWGTRGKSGTDKLKFVPVCEMSNEHLTKILRDERQGAGWVRDIFIEELKYRHENSITVND